jgi:hypothetical protein
MPVRWFDPAAAIILKNPSFIDHGKCAERGEKRNPGLFKTPLAG